MWNIFYQDKKSQRTGDAIDLENHLDTDSYIDQENEDLLSNIQSSFIPSPRHDSSLQMPSQTTSISLASSLLPSKWRRVFRKSRWNKSIHIILIKHQKDIFCSFSTWIIRFDHQQLRKKSILMILSKIKMQRIYHQYITKVLTKIHLIMNSIWKFHMWVKYVL